MMNSIIVLCTLAVIFGSLSVNCGPPGHFTILHGKRSLGFEPKSPEPQIQENSALKNFQGYLEPKYEIVEDESPFRRNQPEVPTKVAHMFGRTLNDRDLEAYLLENYGISDTQSITDLIGIPQPYEDNKILQNRLIDGASAINSGYPLDWRQFNRKSRNDGITNYDIYRYLNGLTKQGSPLSDDNDEIIRRY
ncbi:hypothetical protein ACF0H5_023654 [Mactra antiquata]